MNEEIARCPICNTKITITKYRSERTFQHIDRTFWCPKCGFWKHETIRGGVVISSSQGILLSYIMKIKKLFNAYFTERK